ncbi:hypothetical protein PWT90_03309 [Aphanocladium album]|nr:hypothetical protein PWT90_03309 [Aphanocladium album]
MPGAFHNDIGVATTSQPLLFRPPVSSASPSGSAFLDATPKRKRVRGGTPAATDDAPASASLFGAAAVPQHTPVKAYALAGTLDTPGNADSEVLGESMYSDSNYRTALGSKRSRSDDDDASSGAPTSLFHHDQPDSPSQGWGTAAISVVGGVVGRVWEFCKAGAFKGFYAGGGRGFAMTETGDMVESDGPLPPADDYSYSYHYHYDDYEHRVPGHFPTSQPEYSYRATVDDAALLPSPTPVAPDEQDENQRYRAASPAPSIPAAKRRQTTHADDLGRNWVLVNDGAQQHGRSFAAATPRKLSGAYRASPRNRNYTPSVTTGRRISTTPNSRASMPSAARLSYRPETPSEHEQQLRPPSSASFASPRSSSPTKFAASTAGANTSYYTTASTASTASPSQTHSYSNSQSRGGDRSGGGHRRRRSGNIANTSAHRRANSTASAASSRGDSNEGFNDNSPRLDAEAKHLAARRKMEERDADVRISAFNKRLQDMIRQGKEALGTTIEIDDAGGSDWIDEE